MILPSIINDIIYFSSFSTRLSAIVSTVFILLYYPFGTGYGTYLYFYPKILENSFNLVNKIFLNKFSLSLSSYEISQMISTGRNLGTKAGVMQAIILNGWIGLFFL